MIRKGFGKRITQGQVGISKEVVSIGVSEMLPVSRPQFDQEGLVHVGSSRDVVSIGVSLS